MPPSHCIHTVSCLMRMLLLSNGLWPEAKRWPGPLYYYYQLVGLRLLAVKQIIFTRRLSVHSWNSTKIGRRLFINIRRHLQSINFNCQMSWPHNNKVMNLSNNAFLIEQPQIKFHGSSEMTSGAFSTDLWPAPAKKWRKRLVTTNPHTTTMDWLKEISGRSERDPAGEETFNWIK